MMKYSYRVRDNEWPEATLRLSLYVDPVPGSQLPCEKRTNEEPSISVLYEQKMFITARVNNRRIDRNRKTTAGFGIAQTVNGAHGVQADLLRGER